jgi:hypothetical protein
MPPKRLNRRISLRGAESSHDVAVKIAKRGGKYGVPHKTLRKRYAEVVAAGRAVCWRCEKPIHPEEEWHLDHTDDGRSWAGPEHARCNLSAAGKARAQQLYGTTAKPRREVDGPPRWSRHWSGPFTERCPECRRLGYACPDAETDAECRAWETVLAATDRSERRRRLAEYTELRRRRRGTV